MKRSIVKISSLAIALCVGLFSFSQSTQPSASNFSSKLIGLGVVVSDLDKSLDFYINAIGMVKAYNFKINSEFSKRSGLANGDSASVTVLKLENSPDANE